MNFTGCPTNFAHDNFFVYGEEPAPDGPCLILFPLYLIFYITFIIITLMVAIGRTKHIFRRRESENNRNAKRRYRQFFGVGYLQVLTLVQAWGASFTVFAIMIVPLVKEKPPHQTMTILIGFSNLFSHLSSQGWLNKLLRLGSRIIDPKSTMDGMEDAGKNLAKQDFVLRLLMWSTYGAIVIQLVSMIILAPVYDNDPRWILVGLGMSAVLTLTSLTAHVYQYQRCKNAVVNISKRVLANRQDKGKYAAVLAKFTRHQVILLLSGLTCVIVALLYSVSVIPLNSYLAFVQIIFDSGTNAAMFFTFAKGSRKNGKSNEAAQNSPRMQQTNLIDPYVGPSENATTAPESITFDSSLIRKSQRGDGARVLD